MEETFKAYVAGLFDGYGDVNIRRHKYNRVGGYVLVLELSFTTESAEVVELLANTFGGVVNQTRRGFTYNITRDSARALLITIAPYVLTKKTRVRFALLVYENYIATAQPGLRYVDDKEFATIMSLLDHKGPINSYGKSGEFGERLKMLGINPTAMLTPSQDAEGKGPA